MSNEFMVYLAVMFAILVIEFVLAEIMHCRKGHDVYDWTKRLVKRMDKK